MTVRTTPDMFDDLESYLLVKMNQKEELLSEEEIEEFSYEWYLVHPEDDYKFIDNL